MTRLPETPDQQQDKRRHSALVRYLTTLSEERQVMFLKNLKSERIKMEVTRELEKQMAIRRELVPKKTMKNRHLY